MKYVALTALLLVTALPVHADITIGYAGPISGSYAALGEPVLKGVEVAVADINAKGGINNEKLVLEKADDACDPKQAVNVANQFAAKKVKFVVGHICSSASIAASHNYDEENIMMISPVSTNPALTEAGYKTIFRTCGRDDVQGAAQANYVIKHFRNWKIAVLHDNSTAGRGQSEVFKRTLNAAGVQEWLSDTFVPGEKDYSALVSKLKQRGIQLVQIGGYHTEVALIARQIKQQKADIQIIGGDALTTDEFWHIAGDAAEGVLMSFEPDTRQLPAAREAVESFRKIKYEPAGYTLYGYAATQIIADAIRRAGYPDAVKASMVMHKQKFDTVIGNIGFDDKGDITGSSYVMYKWSKGKYTQLAD